jgi:hypothetical protein
VSRIRPVAAEDLLQVASLFERVMRSGGRAPPPLLAAYFERTLLDQPWADPEIPSLVYEGDDGRILGFLGSHVRRLRFDGRPVRMACPGQLVSDPGHRHHAAGALLMRKFLSGAQDVTVAEGTTAVRRMFETLGGVALQSPSVNWTRLLRPARALGDELLARSRRRRWKAAARPVFATADVAATRIFSGLRIGEPPTQDEPLTPETLIEHLPLIHQRTRVIPEYSVAFLRWLFAEMAFVRTRGTLVRRLVRDQDRVLGWYVTYMTPNGVGQVMQIAGADRDLGAVIDHLFHHAWRSGTLALEGRLEPTLYEPLSGRRCLLRYGSRVLTHCRQPKLLEAVMLGQAFLTRMDGEWWMGHHREPFT